MTRTPPQNPILSDNAKKRIERAIRRLHGPVVIDGETYVVVDIKLLGTLGRWGAA